MRTGLLFSLLPGWVCLDLHGCFCCHDTVLTMIASFKLNAQVDSRDFLLGFAILQAFPGPNFNFAAYLGVLSVPSNPALGALIGWLGIFSPGILLKLSLLPIYNTWRKHEVAKSVLRGLNASATGLVYTAVWQLFLGRSTSLPAASPYSDLR